MATPQRHNVTRAVKARMFDIESTVDYVMDKLDEAYDQGVEDGLAASAEATRAEAACAEPAHVEPTATPDAADAADAPDAPDAANAADTADTAEDNQAADEKATLGGG